MRGFLAVFKSRLGDRLSERLGRSQVLRETPRAVYVSLKLQTTARVQESQGMPDDNQRAELSFLPSSSSLTRARGLYRLAGSFRDIPGT